MDIIMQNNDSSRWKIALFSAISKFGFVQIPVGQCQNYARKDLPCWEGFVFHRHSRKVMCPTHIGGFRTHLLELEISIGYSKCYIPTRLSKKKRDICDQPSYHLELQIGGAS